MNAAEIGSYELDLPEIDEQKKIADALASVDAKIGAVDAQIERMETFRSGLIQGLFP